MSSDYTDDITLLANTPTQAESLMPSLEQADGGIGFFMNANKMEYMHFNQEGALSTRNGPLKLINKFTCFGSSISSTESDVNICLAKVWTAIDRLLIM